MFNSYDTIIWYNVYSEEDSRFRDIAVDISTILGESSIHTIDGFMNGHTQNGEVSSFES